MFKKIEISSNTNQVGSFLLFFAVGILPLLIFMMALSLDITNYLRADQQLQQTADDAALLAWRYLPYKAQAVEAVNRFIAQQGLGTAVSEVRIAPARIDSQQFNDEFEVILEQRLPLTFMSYLAVDAELPIKSVARARATPLDVYIAVDRSSYVAPSLLSNVWSNPQVSAFFRHRVPFNDFINPETGLIESSPPAEFMTQLCFNPYFSELKRTALSLYEYLSAAGRNGVGVGVFPGIEFDSLRTIRPLLRAAQNLSPAIANSGEAQALQKLAQRNYQDYYYYNGVRLGASSWCAAAAAEEGGSGLGTPNPYNEDFSASIEKIWKAPIETKTFKSDITIEDSDDIVFNPTYQSALTVKEVLWSAVAKPTTVNTRQLIDSVLANLVNGPDTESIKGASIRGGLTGTSTRTGIILAGDVPRLNGVRFKAEDDSVASQLGESFGLLRKLVNENLNLRVKIAYIIIDDPQRPASDLSLDMQERARALSTFFHNQQAGETLEGRLNLQVIYSNNFRNLNEELLATLILENQRKVLSY